MVLFCISLSSAATKYIYFVVLVVLGAWHAQYPRTKCCVSRGGKLSLALFFFLFFLMCRYYYRFIVLGIFCCYIFYHRWLYFILQGRISNEWGGEGVDVVYHTTMILAAVYNKRYYFRRRDGGLVFDFVLFPFRVFICVWQNRGEFMVIFFCCCVFPAESR